MCSVLRWTRTNVTYCNYSTSRYWPIAQSPRSSPLIAPPDCSNSQTPRMQASMDLHPEQCEGGNTSSPVTAPDDGRTTLDKGEATTLQTALNMLK